METSCASSETAYMWASVWVATLTDSCLECYLQDTLPLLAAQMVHRGGGFDLGQQPCVTDEYMEAQGCGKTSSHDHMWLTADVGFNLRAPCWISNS